MIQLISNGLDSARNFLVYNRTASQLAYIPIGVNTAMGLARIVVHITSLAKNIFLLIANSYSRQAHFVKPLILLNIAVDKRGTLRGLLEVVPILGSFGCLLYNKFLTTPAQKLAYRTQEIYSSLTSENKPLHDPSFKDYTPEAAQDLIALNGKFYHFKNQRTYADLRDLAMAGKLQGFESGFKAEPNETENTKQIRLISYQLEQLDSLRDEKTLQTLAAANANELKMLQKEKLEAVSFFLNGQPARFSTDVAKIQKFLDLASRWDYDDPLFSDKKILYYAFSAFAMGLIDAGDFATLSEIYITKKCFPDCKIHRVLDDQNKITKEGKAFIDTLLKPINDGMAISSDETHIIQFIKQLKPYQQAFWTHKSLITSAEMFKLENQSPLMALEMLYAPIGSLAATLATLGVVYQVGGRQVGMGVHLHQRGINQLFHTTKVPYVPKLGTFTPKQIIEGVEKGHRLGATYFQGSFPDTVHNSFELPTVIIEHDKVHAHILHKHGEKLMNTIFRMLSVIKKVTGFEMSKEIWLIGEAVACLFAPESTLFSFMKYYGGKVDEAQMRDMFWDNFNSKRSTPTPTLWMILLDMEENGHCYSGLQDVMYWKEMSVIRTAKKIGLISEHDDPKIKIWVLQQLWNNIEIDAVSKLKAKMNPNRLKFCKITKSQCNDPKLLNKIVLRSD